MISWDEAGERCGYRKMNHTPRAFMKLQVCIMLLILLGCNYLRIGKRTIFRNVIFFLFIGI